MKKAEKQLLHDETGDAEPRLVLRTRTRVDTGRWWRRSPLWLCVLADDLALVAVGRRRHFERIAIADCPGTHYSNAGGALVIEPGETLRFSQLRMSPSEALQVLDLLNSTSGLSNRQN